MNPLPKKVGLVATIAALATTILTVLQTPVIHDLVTSFVQAHPQWSVGIATAVALLTALSHSLTGDGGDGSKPVN